MLRTNFWGVLLSRKQAPNCFQWAMLSPTFVFLSSDEDKREGEKEQLRKINIILAGPLRPKISFPSSFESPLSNIYTLKSLLVI